jgi:hypothetical protein
MPSVFGQTLLSKFLAPCSLFDIFCVVALQQNRSYRDEIHRENNQPKMLSD